MVSGARKRVVILRDTCAPLWFIRCEKPCGDDGQWCMRGPEGRHAPHCWIGCGSDREKVAQMAERGGHYEVVG